MGYVLGVDEITKQAPQVEFTLTARDEAVVAGQLTPQLGVYGFVHLIALLILLLATIVWNQPLMLCAIPVGAGVLLVRRIRQPILNAVDPLRIRFTEQGISARQKNGELSELFLWTDIELPLSIRGYLVFTMRSPLLRIVIPKHAFPSEADADEMYRTADVYWRKAQVRRHELGMCKAQTKRLPISPDPFWAMTSIAAVVYCAGNGWPLLVSFLSTFVVSIACAGDSSAYRLADAYVSHRKFREALEALKPALVSRNRYAAPFVTASLCHLHLSNAQEAIRFADMALARDPNAAMALYLRAQAKYREFDLDGAKQDASNALALSPGTTEAIVLLAAIAIMQCDFSGALLMCERALKIDPTCALALRLKAWTYFNMCRLSDAQKYCEMALQCSRTAGETGAILCSLAVIKLRHGLLEESKTLIDRTVELCPSGLGVSWAKIDLLMRLGRFGDALNEANSLYESDSTRQGRAEALHSRGMCNLMLGLIDEGVSDTAAAVEIYPTSVYLTGHAAARYKAGDLSGALDLLDRALAKDVFDAEAFWFREHIRRELGDIEGADSDKAKWTDFGYVPYLNAFFDHHTEPAIITQTHP